MTEIARTTLLCPNGHLIEPGWEVCPHCPSTRAFEPLAPTVRMPPTGSGITGAGEGPSADRRTVLLGLQLARQAVAWLVAVDEPRRGQTLRIDRARVSIGADAGADLVIDEPHTSARHATIRFADGRFTLRDAGSSNGTCVGDQPIDEIDIHDGDRIRFGTSTWVFKCVLFDPPATSGR
jgi:hypothetical protein